MRAADGSFSAVAITDLDGDGTRDLAVFEGVESGLLDDDDPAQVASLIAPGSAVGLLVYETPGSALRSRHAGSGGEALAAGRIPGDDVIAM